MTPESMDVAAVQSLCVRFKELRELIFPMSVLDVGIIPGETSGALHL
jgi:hypothetical protein